MIPELAPESANLCPEEYRQLNVKEAYAWTARLWRPDMSRSAQARLWKILNSKSAWGHASLQALDLRETGEWLAFWREAVVGKRLTSLISPDKIFLHMTVWRHARRANGGVPDPACPRCHGTGQVTQGEIDALTGGFQRMTACDCTRVKESVA
jgi:hypothetical protein